MEGYAEELDVAVKAVQLACALSQKVQQSLVSKSIDQLNSKEGNSLVTIADWSIQATVSWILSESFGCTNVSIVSKKDAQNFSGANPVALLESVVETVNEYLTKARDYGLGPPEKALGTAEVLEAISRCNSPGDPMDKGRFWVLEPLDSRLGFALADQYAIALTLIEEGEVVLGVLGCPNYPIKKDWLSYSNQYRRIIYSLTSPTSESWEKGCVLYTKKGSGAAWTQPLLCRNKGLKWANHTKPVRLSSIDNPEQATFCEQLGKASSSHSFTAALAQSAAIRKQPLRLYGMVRYAALAHGDAEVYIKFAKAGYKEKVWDHAAGVLIIQEAGGVVTDVGGSSLSFSNGIYLDDLDRGVIACTGGKLHSNIISAVDASWESSCL